LVPPLAATGLVTAFQAGRPGEQHADLFGLDVAGRAEADAVARFDIAAAGG
jgi:hypothetical protein